MLFVQSLRDAVNFKVARWTHDRWPKINKSLSVSNGVGASSFEIWTANLAQPLTMGTLTNSRSFIFGDSNWKFCKVGYPVGPHKPDFQMRTFLTSDFFFFFMLLFFSQKKKKKTCWIYKNTVFTNWEKDEVSWNFCLVIIIDLKKKSCIPGSFEQLLPFAWDFVVKGQRLVWGQVG